MRRAISTVVLLSAIGVAVSFWAPSPTLPRCAGEGEGRVGPVAAVESGQLAYLREGRPFGSERWSIERAADGSSEVKVGVIFANTKIRGAGHLKLDPLGHPTGYEFKVERTKGAARITATFAGGKAHCEVHEASVDREGKSGPEKLALSRDVDLPADFSVVEEGVVSFDSFALRKADRAKTGEQELKVLVPQLGEVHSFLVTTKGEERLTLGDKGSEVTVAAVQHVVRYRGSEQNYWLDASGRLVRCTAASAAGNVEIAMVTTRTAGSK